MQFVTFVLKPNGEKWNVHYNHNSVFEMYTYIYIYRVSVMYYV